MDRVTSKGGLAMSTSAWQTHQHAAGEQWVIPLIVAAWVIVLLSGLLVLG